MPAPEGRMRLSENQFTVEPKTTKYNVRSSVDKSIAKNPFEEYDEAMNPFADDDADEAKSFNDDYDKNLNPFAS